MKKIKNLSVLIMFIVFVAGFMSCTNASNKKNQTIKKKYKMKTISKYNNSVPFEYLIQLKSDFKKETLEKLIENYKIKEIQKISKGLFRVRFEKDSDMEKIKTELEKNDKVKYIQPNYIYQISPKKKRFQMKK